MECPKDAPRGKVSQVNGAFEAWTKTHRDVDPHSVYVGVYDADSAPDPLVLARISEVIAQHDAAQRKRPAILQQVSSYCVGLDTMRGFVGALRLADALAQTRWALGFEYPLYETFARSVHRGTLRPLIYCVGHGCFVSAATLNAVGGFPTISPNDDLALGYLASSSAFDVHPIPALDYCEVAPNPLVLIRQARFWYAGSARFWKDIVEFRRTFPVKRNVLQDIVLWSSGHGRRIAWAWRAALWTFALVAAGRAQAWSLIIALVVLHALYVHAGFLQTIFALREIPCAADVIGLRRVRASQWLLAFALASFVFVIRSLGPLSAALVGPARGAFKTER